MPSPEHRPAAFVLTGAFRVICRNHKYLTALARRGLRALVLCPESSREQAQAVLAAGAGPVPTIAEVAYAAGELDQEGSFVPDVLAVLGDWRDRYRIVGVYAMEETLVEPTGLVCDLLGVPAPGLRASRVCRNKYLQRGYLAPFSPQSTIVPPGRRHTVDLAAQRYPVVVKPATRHASSGVLACERPDEVAALLPTYRPHETVLIEQKVVGQEFSVESLVSGGEVRFASVTRKETTDTTERTFVELVHSVPAGREVTETLLTEDRKVLRALDFADGVAHSEWRVTDAGETFLMEIASRTPGDGLTLLYEFACGRPIEEQIIAIALGEQVDYPAPRRRARQVYLRHPVGVLREVTVDWPGVRPVWLGDTDLWPAAVPGNADDPPALRLVLVLKERGSELGQLISSDDRAVTFFIDADTEAELDQLEHQVRAAIALSVDPLAVDPLSVEAVAV
ncbi:ATP-grasp domain-containing protein [Actinophytocola sediminis]